MATITSPMRPGAIVPVTRPTLPIMVLANRIASPRSPGRFAPLRKSWTTRGAGCPGGTGGFTGGPPRSRRGQHVRSPAAAPVDHDLVTAGLLGRVEGGVGAAGPTPPAPLPT